MSRIIRGLSTCENLENVVINDLNTKRSSLDCGYDQKVIFSKLNEEKNKNSCDVTSIQSPIIVNQNNKKSFDINFAEQQVFPNENSSKMSSNKKLYPNSEPNEESEWVALGQLLVPFLIAGFGNVAAGIILDKIQYWQAFKKIPQLLILVPALIGLKGNVEMTLASRLSTHSNLGDMDSAKELKSIIIGNMALVQCQASVVGLIAPLFAIALSFITKSNNGITFDEMIVVTASSVITANIANLFLGTLMFIVVLLSRKFNINPDNVGTPIAASLGDFTTMLLLAYISQSLFETVNWLSGLFIIVLMSFTPLWAIIARRVSYTKSILYMGWIPILGAMIVQNTGGLIMQNALTQFQRLAAFQPIINGVGGNLVAIQSSRMSTYLHKNKDNDKLASTDAKECTFPFKTFFGKNRHTLMARILLLIAGPSHILFLFALRIMKGHFLITLSFLIFYLSAALIQVSLLLDICSRLVKWIFERGLDPDCFAIPFLTALADLLGSGLLALSFFILYHLNDSNALE